MTFRESRIYKNNSNHAISQAFSELCLHTLHTHLLLRFISENLLLRISISHFKSNRILTYKSQMSSISLVPTPSIDIDCQCHGLLAEFEVDTFRK